jgi:hypothetical protein
VLKFIIEVAVGALVGFVGAFLPAVYLIRRPSSDLSRYRRALVAIAGLELSEPPTTHATAAQWMRSIARDALDPKRHSAPDPRADLDRRIGAAMTGRPPLHQVGPNAAPPVARGDDVQ